MGWALAPNVGEQEHAFLCHFNVFFLEPCKELQVKKRKEKGEEREGLTTCCLT